MGRAAPPARWLLAAWLLTGIFAAGAAAAANDDGELPATARAHPLPDSGPERHHHHNHRYDTPLAHSGPEALQLEAELGRRSTLSMRSVSVAADAAGGPVHEQSQRAGFHARSLPAEALGLSGARRRLAEQPTAAATAPGDFTPLLLLPGQAARGAEALATSSSSLTSSSTAGGLGWPGIPFEDLVAATEALRDGAGTGNNSSGGAAGATDASDLLWRVVGGRQADPDNYRWIASLRDANGRHYCGGSLVAPRVVLTAAHCVDRSEAALRNPVVHIGRYFTESTDSQGHDVRRCVVTIVHPDWSFSNGRNDLAVCLLNTASSRPTVRVASGTVRLDAATGLQVLGFGSPAEGQPNNEYLSDAVVFAQDIGECNRTYGGLIGRYQICAGRELGGVDACQGDSGGPLLLPRGTRTSVFTAAASPADTEALEAAIPGSDEDVLLGVVSWGRGCGVAGSPGVYTNLVHYRSWINQQLADYDLPPLPVAAVPSAQQLAAVISGQYTCQAPPSLADLEERASSLAEQGLELGAALAPVLTAYGCVTIGSAPADGGGSGGGGGGGSGADSGGGSSGGGGGGGGPAPDTPTTTNTTSTDPATTTDSKTGTDGTPTNATATTNATTTTTTPAAAPAARKPPPRRPPPRKAKPRACANGAKPVDGKCPAPASATTSASESAAASEAAPAPSPSPPPPPPEDPCRCAADGVSGNVTTPLLGCGQHGAAVGDYEYYCMVAGGRDGCALAVPSRVYLGAAWLDCEPTVKAAATAVGDVAGELAVRQAAGATAVAPDGGEGGGGGGAVGVYVGELLAGIFGLLRAAGNR
ncbi:hypothetical protein GPECTOR_15g379 [Gonium pectorale]|uniref:Peptidase S1 domain-containing protein n=1 Tax=Gonium pectorale TaxID=33097 RepID=A0A150GLS3_GONPE|nr:hypothetical protein GPECTOR_15g379 [Gonium pectorale]|eukprot:KXZ50695.1 hypothetical protein GPECTOR_15g379 [Gonium pectorale]